MKMPEYVAVKIMPDKKGTSYNLEVVTDADFVNVVRCKDCKHLHNFNLASGTELPNKFYCGSMTESGRYKQVKLDDFCAWGEKDE